MRKDDALTIAVELGAEITLAPHERLFRGNLLDQFLVSQGTGRQIKVAEPGLIINVQGRRLPFRLDFDPELLIRFAVFWWLTVKLCGLGSCAKVGGS